MALVDFIPNTSPVVEQQSRLITGEWYRWLFNVVDLVKRSPTVFAAQVDLTNQNDAIPTTNIPLGALSSGDYLLTVYARVTTTDGVDSSVTPTIGWTESSVPLSIPVFTLSGDTVTTVGSAVITINSDANSPITYAMAYASNTPNKMHYKLRILVESLAS